MGFGEQTRSATVVMSFSEQREDRCFTNKKMEECDGFLLDFLRKRAFHRGRCVGTVVCKMGEHRHTFRGYIAMLVVIKAYRGKGIATDLVTRSIKVMMESGCDEVTLEAEVTNKGALALYGGLGFIRAKRLFRYYLNGVDAFRLKLLFPRPDLQPSLQTLAYKDEHDFQIPIEGCSTNCSKF
uniref:N-acetyltransferase domain-containing protein n=1 Tax=Chenopodium quinoa TaxID=63459 RepID=A0A803MZI2_CHEQI